MNHKPLTGMRTDEHGIATVMVAVLAVTVIAAGGLVFDGGRLMAARREAATVAASSARIAAQELDVDLFETGDTVTLDTTVADSSARTFLTEQGYDNFDITITGDTVRVIIRDDVALTLLTVLGGNTRRVVGTATAQLRQQPF
jgi:Flp pilus assembly protein TadG